MNFTIEYINTLLAEAEAADRLASGEVVEPSPNELRAVLEGIE